MANLANMNLEINEEVIQTIFKETLNQSIITAMGNKEDFMSALINNALNEKVDDRGEVSRYSSDNKYRFWIYMLKKSYRLLQKMLLTNTWMKIESCLKPLLNVRWKKKKINLQL